MGFQGAHVGGNGARLQRLLMVLGVVAGEDRNVAPAGEVERAVGAEQRFQPLAVAIKGHMRIGMARQSLQQGGLAPADLVTGKVLARRQKLASAAGKLFLPGSATIGNAILSTKRHWISAMRDRQAFQSIPSSRREKK